MEENIVTFQVAKLAKEKGFDGYCYDAYNKNGMQYSNGWCEYIDDNEEDIPFNKSILRNNDVLAPIQSLLQKWLREKHYVDIHIKRQKPRYPGYTVEVYIVKPKDSTYIYFGLKEDDNNQYKIFDVYEEALEEALYQALLKI